jgi:ATP-dependent DNA helicase RecQ
MENQIPIQKIIADYEGAIAKIILYCLTELPFPLGIKKTISVLKGTKSTFAINNKLNELKTFSILPSFSQDQLTAIIGMLIQAGLIKIRNVLEYDNMPVLNITELGKDYLDQKEHIQIALVDAFIDNKIPEFNDIEKNLFIKLRTLRRDIAQQYDLPAYLICGDQILREICLKKPTDREQLINVKGIGQKFVDKYGDLFLDRINEICSQQSINEK